MSFSKRRERLARTRSIARVGITVALVGGLAFLFGASAAPAAVNGIYWTVDGVNENNEGTANNAIWHANGNGSSPAVLVNRAFLRPQDIEVYDGHLFWADLVPGTVVRSDLNGANQSTWVSGLNFPTGVAVDGRDNALFVVSSSNQQVVQASLNASGSGTNFASFNGIYAYDLEADLVNNQLNLAYAHPDTGASLRRSALISGSSFATIEDLPTFTHCIALDTVGSDVTVYFQGSTAAQIFSRSAAGPDNSRSLFLDRSSVASAVWGMDIDSHDRRLYWIETRFDQTSDIMSASLADPSNTISTVVGGLTGDHPFFLALDTVPEPNSFVLLAGGGFRLLARRRARRK
jgi:hypothetical protein